MPYIPGSGRISDVYRSTNVFANSVPVALWLAPGASSAFAGVDVDAVAPLVDPTIVTLTAGNTNSMVAQQQTNPNGANSFYNGLAANDGVKGNYVPAEDGVDINDPANTGTVSVTTSAASIVAFLDQALSEAGKGMWRETGQGGKPSNPNITNIWANLGFGTSSPWNSDQTAWCMGFVNFALKASGYKYVKTAAAAAITKNPSAWNATPVPKDQAQPGDIAYWTYGHVNFVYKANGGKFSFVGGNQSPAVKTNNPNDGDVTLSWPGGTPATNPTWVSCFRPSKT